MTVRIKLWVAATAIGCAITLTLLLIWPTSDAPSFTSIKQTWRPSDADLLDRHGELLDRQRLDFGIRRAQWVPLSAISPALVTAVVDGEDRGFFQHHGVDWLAFLSALRDRTVDGRRRGASTITMQVASFVDARARAGRSPGALNRKLAQVRLARGIERHWNKQEILEAYLNLLGYRGELQGIGAAAQVMAGKTPSGLSLPESLVLAALLPAPRATSERVVARACARAKSRQLSVDCESLRTTANVLLANNNAMSLRAAEPHLAPHLAHLLLREPGERVRTTLDKQTQRLAQESLQRHLSGLADRNVRDGAVLVVDNDTGDVLAYVGSAGPQSRSAAVDGVRARRQAGSTLKPFLYELALERRYLTAASLLDDSPLALDSASGTYLPQNYDRDFKGLVSVRTALASSLNVPAVRTLVLTGVEPFRDRLNQLGYSGIKEDGEFYGYSLALGSAEVSLWEQVQAYRTLARGGLWSILRLRNSAAEATANKLISSAAAFIITDILSDRSARALSFGLDNHLNTPFWSAAKTGTSKDMRDNWCLGFSSRYTVGVWVGNFEGDSMHDVSGITGAAPVWSEIMIALHTNESSIRPVAPEGVTHKQAHFAPAVETPRPEWFLTGTDTPRIATIPAKAELARIASPANGMIIAIDPDIPPVRQRVPFDTKGADEHMTFRLNGATVGPARRSLMWAPAPGTYKLELVSRENRVEDRISFIVR